MENQIPFRGRNKPANRVKNLKVIKTNDDNVYPYFCIAPPSNPQNQNFHWISHGFDDSAPDRGLSICGNPHRPSVHAGNDGSGPGTACALFHALDHDGDLDRARGPGPGQHPDHPARATPTHVHNFCAMIPWTPHWFFSFPSFSPVSPSPLLSHLDLH